MVCEPCLLSLQPSPYFQSIPEVSSVYSLFPYDGLIKTLLGQLKFEGVKPLGKVLNQRLISPPFEKIDFRIPIPVHKKRRRSRGFNQVDLIFDGYNCNPMVQRIKNTDALFDQSPEQRRHTVSGAFKLDGNIEGKRIVLLDDICTTGATLSEVAKLLRSHGASDVFGFTLAYAAR